MLDIHLARQQRLVALLSELQCDAFLVTKYINVTYLTGFTGDSSYLLVTPDRTLIFSDSRYDTQLADQCPDLDRVIRDATSTMMDMISAETTGIQRLGIEADSLTLTTAEDLRSAVTAELVPTRGVLDGLREIKDSHELDLIRKSIHLAEASMRELHQRLRPDMTERDLEAELEYIIRHGGGEGCAFDPILGVGSNGALPHAHTTDRRLDAHSVLLTDWGALRKGYMSDLTRVWFTDTITPEIEAVYGVVLTAQLRAIEQIRPGAKMADVDQAARATIADAGYGEYFGHGLGHGFGLEIHEQPRLAPRREGQASRALQPGMVVTVEPGIYLPGNFGVRIEDDVLVTEDGHEVLSTIEKDLDACRLKAW